MCPSVWSMASHCQRYNGIHCPTGPQIGLRPPTAVSIHSLHTGEVCGLLEPTSSFSTTAFCCYMGVVPKTHSILVPSQHLLRGSVTPCQALSVQVCCYKGMWWAITSLSCETKEKKIPNFPRETRQDLTPTCSTSPRLAAAGGDPLLLLLYHELVLLHHG